MQNPEHDGDGQQLARRVGVLRDVPGVRSRVGAGVPAGGLHESQSRCEVQNDNADDVDGARAAAGGVNARQRVPPAALARHPDDEPHATESAYDQQSSVDNASGLQRVAVGD